jgi:hypothetical protein
LLVIKVDLEAITRFPVISRKLKMAEIAENG